MLCYMHETPDTRRYGEMCMGDKEFTMRAYQINCPTATNEMENEHLAQVKSMIGELVSTRHRLILLCGEGVR
jgi:hypothetical protein